MANSVIWTVDVKCTLEDIPYQCDQRKIAKCL